MFQELYNISTIENCVTACAQYNYQLPGFAGFDGSTGGGNVSKRDICDGVFWGYNGTLTTGNHHPTRCYLKNGAISNMLQAESTGHAALLDLDQ